MVSCRFSPKTHPLMVRFPACRVSGFLPGNPQTLGFVSGDHSKPSDLGAMPAGSAESQIVLGLKRTVFQELGIIQKKTHRYQINTIFWGIL